MKRESNWSVGAWLIGYFSMWVYLMIATDVNMWLRIPISIVPGLIGGIGWPIFKRWWRKHRQERLERRRQEIERKHQEIDRRWQEVDQRLMREACAMFMTPEEVANFLAPPPEAGLETASEAASEAVSGAVGTKFSEMRKQFTRWKRENPKLEAVISPILGQFDLLKKQRRILKDLLRDEENWGICEEHTTLFNTLVDQIRQNFVDMMNIFILAGANFGGARLENLDTRMLENELSDNLKKLEMLKRVNEQVLKTINRGVDTMADIATESELSALERANDTKAEAEMLAAGKSPFMEKATGAAAAQSAKKK